ncbi:MAG: GTP 3',8-cyclase MoaA [Phycisphaerales bacterium]|nr:MAG: GTP 3',8-cyclase MoaA [Phycisphaerales bacterium]
MNYLRISVTDRCNLRCTYCSPPGACDFIPHEEILTFEEIERLVGLLAGCGIRKVRLTGGEPLVRKGIVELVRRLAPIEGIEEVSLTTNGVLLAPMAAELKAAGAGRVNISIDSMKLQTYQQMTGFDALPEAISGIHKAIEVGLTPVRINSVIVKGLNDSVEEIEALAGMSMDLAVAVRFIEYCPTDTHTSPASSYVPNSEIRCIIESRLGTLVSVPSGDMDGPAVYFKAPSSAGTIGFISGRSLLFCPTCNRLRLTSDGRVKPCLYAAPDYDLKTLLRSGAGDEQVRDLLRSILRGKGQFTRVNSAVQEFRRFSMQSIGG